MTTDRLILREYDAADEDAYYQLKSDPQTMYYLRDIQLHSREEAAHDLASVLADQQQPDRRFYFFHIELKDTHEQVGSIGYTVLDDTPVGKHVNAGYFTWPRFWGNGYVTEAFRRLLAYAFDEGRVYRVTTGCLAENVGSARVMQKCGLIREAEHIDWEWHDGQMKTRLEYRLLQNEWQAMHAAPAASAAVAHEPGI